MRVELPKNPPPAGTPRSPGTTTPESPASVDIAPRASRRQQILNAATRWLVVVPALLLAVTVLSWSLLWRLPEKNRLLTVSARELTPPVPLAKPVSDEELTELRQRFQQSAANFVLRREDIGPLVAQLETRARKFSLWMEFTLKPAVVLQVGQKEFVRHPVSIQLVDDYGQDGAAHKRFYAWMREAVTIDKRAEITALLLRGNGAGLAEAHVELQLFSLNSHAEVASK